jgi:hypothetical protein
MALAFDRVLSLGHSAPQLIRAFPGIGERDLGLLANGEAGGLA